MTDTYNGWSNRETWGASLHIGNDEGLYDLVTEWARDAVDASEGAEDPRRRAIRTLADQLQDQFEEWEQDLYDAATGHGEHVTSGLALMFQDGSLHVTSGLALMFQDIGSLYRVDWDEVAASYIDEARRQASEDAS